MHARTVLPWIIVMYARMLVGFYKHWCLCGMQHICMGVTACIGMAMGEMRVEASRRAHKLGEGMKWLAVT